MHGNGSALLSLYKSHYSYPPDMERQAVSCADAPEPPLIPASTNEQVVDEMLAVAREVSSFDFSILTTEPDLGRHHWSFEPPDKFVGPFNGTLRSPIWCRVTLWVFSSGARGRYCRSYRFRRQADPVTLLDSAHKPKALPGDSAVLLIQDAPGHMTTSAPTACMVSKTRRYFDEGVMPEDRSVCIFRGTLFPREGEDVSEGHGKEEERWVKAAEELGLMASGRRAAALSHENSFA